MDKQFYQQLTADSLADKPLDRSTAQAVLSSDGIELLPLISAAYDVRKIFFGNKVSVHIINNAQNGLCPEDCHYCAQAKTSEADIAEYTLKSDQEILAEAKNAYEKGAHRYCMVFAGRGPSQRRVEHLAQLIQSIKTRYPIEVCVSAGLLDKAKAKTLKDAGLDRLNHNLNTSAKHYPNICTTHTYMDRVNTLTAARQAGLQLCSGVILGMGEDISDVVETAYTLREMSAESIPVNFFIPIKGTELSANHSLTPAYCLRALCLYRFLNPKAEIRVAAGRELHLRSLEVFALYPANSLFLDGYLNAKGEGRSRTYQMLKDAGFAITSDHSLDDLLANETPLNIDASQDRIMQSMLKGIEDLRPEFTP